jgi:plasmid stabilization system protein ParE
MAEYSLSNEAEDDIDKVVSYTLSEYGPDQARRYYRSIHEASQFAADFPELGRRYSTQNGVNYRVHSVGRHALFYQNDIRGIFVSRVLHLAMDFDRLLDSQKT